MVELSKYEVKPEELRWYADAQEFRFKSTSNIEEPKNLEEIVKGQEIAKRQLKDAIRLRQNAILVGPPGCGKSLLANKLAEQYNMEIQNRIPLQDQLLAHNFDDSFEPLALEIPTPRGEELKKDLDRMMNDIKHGRLTKNKLSKSGVKEIRKDMRKLQKIKDYNLKQIEELKQSDKPFIEITNEPPDNPIEVFRELFKSEGNVFWGSLKMKKEDAIKMQEKIVEQLESRMDTLKGQLNQRRPEELLDKYSEFPRIREMLENIINDLLENFPERTPMMGPFMQRPDDMDKELEKYKVNLIVNNKNTKGLPLQFIQNPTVQNLIGDVQHDPYGLGGRKPHMRAKSGKLPKANDGIAVIDELITIFKNPVLSDQLLTVLEEREVRIGGGHGLVGGGTSAGVESEPVQANCIIIGCANEDIRKYTSPKMSRRFKHKILFDTNMPNTEENRKAYANFVAHEVNDYNSNNREQIPHFTREGIAAIIEEGARFATRFGNTDKRKYLTNVLDTMKDIVQKSGLKALDNKHNHVTQEDVEEAAADIRQPALKEQIDYAERVKNGTLILHTQGKEVGYVNGLVVHPDPFMTEYFGFPARLEATASAGNRGLISTTKEAKLSENIFTKSIEVITGYFKQRYEQDNPQFYEARIDFNQLYNPLDGDSASIATTLAYLSAFSNIPLKQCIAVTGSMNLRGDVQAVGGVNEKIEGFYRLCREQGLLEDAVEDYGVMIPKANVQSLMLDKELIHDIEKGSFHIYAVSTLDDAIEIMTEEEPSKVHEAVLNQMNVYSKGFQKKRR